MILTSHSTTWHDGGVALWDQQLGLIALASERVGDRFKHSWNSRLAYEHLRSTFPQLPFGGAGDQFVDTAGGLTTDHHHLYHAASTAYASGFADAAVLVVDGQGPAGDHLASTTLWSFTSAQGLTLVEELHPEYDTKFAARSLGHFYTAIGSLAGMTDLYCEGKTMALAAYGGPSQFMEEFEQRVIIHEDGTYDIDPIFTTSILSHTLGPKLFGWPAPSVEHVAEWRRIEDLRTDDRGVWPSFDDANIAWAGQRLFERMMLGLARRISLKTGQRRLCIAGGAALNCVANGLIARAGLFDRVFVVPSCADDGQALGKLYLEIGALNSTPPTLANAFLGPPYSGEIVDHAVNAFAAQNEAHFEARRVPTDDEACRSVADLILLNRIVGCWRGRSELGPRALGHRSILANAQSPTMRSRVNKVKEREWFRPVAPMILEEEAVNLFGSNISSPFMTFTFGATTAGRRAIPSGVHIDGTARLQTVGPNDDRWTYNLLQQVKASSGIGAVLNTSFNARNEPMVESPSDALTCFIRLGLDAILLGDWLITSRAEPRE